MGPTDPSLHARPRSGRSASRGMPSSRMCDLPGSRRWLPSAHTGTSRSATSPPQEREELEAIRTSHTAELQHVLASQEQCAVQGDKIEATCRTEWNRQIEETRAHYEEQKEIVREERDLELENTRQNLDAELARVRAEYTTQYEAIQQSREQQILRLTEEREA